MPLPTHLPAMDGTMLPVVGDDIEAERCPNCGKPGVLLEDFGDYQVWGCPCAAQSAD